MSLEKHAEIELKAAGLFNKDSDYSGMLGEAVMELVKVFAKQGHSGASAAMTRQLFGLVGDYQPLTPLTGKDDEWNEVGSGVFQNKRCGHVFKEKDGAYDIDGKVFREPSGATFTSKDSRVSVTFPYTPKTEYVDVPREEKTD